MVIQARYRPDIVSGFAVLPEDEDAVRDAVGELPLLRAEVRQGADGVCLCVVSHQVPLVEVLAICHQRSSAGTVILCADQRTLPLAVSGGGNIGHACAYNRTADLIPRFDVRRDGGLLRINGLVVVQQCGGGNGGIGEIPLVQTQLTEGAEHSVREDAPELAPLDLLPAGEDRLVKSHGHQVPLVDIPRAGDDLDGLVLPHIHPAYPHVVRVRVALHGRDPARCHVGDLCAQVLRPLHLGAGEGHGLGEILVIGVNGDELVEPFSAQFHISQTSFYVVFFLFFSL